MMKFSFGNLANLWSKIYHPPPLTTPKNTRVKTEYQKVIILFVFNYSNFFNTTDKYQVGGKFAPKAQKDRPQNGAV
jgi:hypothetical protein